MALVWQTDSRGGFLTSPELSKKMRVKAQTKQRFRNFVNYGGAENLGMHKGDTLQYVKVGDAGDGRAVSETETTPTDNLTFYRSSVTALEFTLGIDYSWRLDILAELDIYNNIVMALTNSMARTLDRACAAQFRTADLVYTPTGSKTVPSYTLGTAGVALAAATRAFSVWDHMNIMDLMEGTYNMPFYDGEGFQCIGTTKFLRTFKEDGRFERAVTPNNANRIFKGEVGELDNCRFTKETNAMSNALAEAIYLAADPVIEIVVYPEEIQAKLGADYGRDRGLRWVYYGNWAKTWDYTTEGEARMIRVYSL